MLRMNKPPTVQLAMLATNIDVKMPNAITSSKLTPSAGTLNTDGPGLNPPMLSMARIRKTAAALPGMPNERTGMRFAPETDEFAASVAATPSGIPSPNFASSGRVLLACARLPSVYPNVAASVLPIPGSAPIAVPITDDRPITGISDAISANDSG